MFESVARGIEMSKQLRKYQRPDDYSYLMVVGVVESVGKKMFGERYIVGCLPQDITTVMANILYSNCATDEELNTILCGYEDLIFTGCVGGVLK